MNRLYVGRAGPHGHRRVADHRLAPPRLARSPARRGRSPPPSASRSPAATDAGAPLGARGPAWVKAVAQGPAGASRQRVVVVGDAQPAEVHALAHAINAALGNVGTTVRYIEPRDASPATHGPRRALVGRDARRQGRHARHARGQSRSTRRPPTCDFAERARQGEADRLSRGSTRTRRRASCRGSCPRRTPRGLGRRARLRRHGDPHPAAHRAALRRPHRRPSSWPPSRRSRDAGLRHRRQTRSSAHWRARRSAARLRQPAWERRPAPGVVDGSAAPRGAGRGERRPRGARGHRRRLATAGRRRARAQLRPRLRRSTTAASPTTPGCSSCPSRSPSSPGTTRALVEPGHRRARSASRRATSSSSARRPHARAPVLSSPGHADGAVTLRSATARPRGAETLRRAASASTPTRCAPPTRPPSAPGLTVARRPASATALRHHPDRTGRCEGRPLALVATARRATARTPSSPPSSSGQLPTLSRRQRDPRPATQWAMAIDISRLHRLQRLRGRLPGGEQHPRRRQERASCRAARCTGCASTRYFAGDPRRARRSSTSRCSASTARRRPASTSARSTRRSTAPTA